jgi:hypothetical protein
VERVVHVPEALYARLETLAEGKRDEDSLFTLACHRLGLPPTGLHRLRYDFAARLRARLIADGWAADAANPTFPCNLAIVGLRSLIKR